MKKSEIKKMVLSALFLALGFVLPLFTSQIKEIGDSLLPMHLPVLLCGILCGGNYGFLVGLCLPFFRSAVFGMPPIYPNAVWMASELMTYGFVIGFMYNKIKIKNILGIYISLISAMISGRIIWGIAKTILLGIGGKSFTVFAFITGGFIDAFPGIVIQLVLIPTIVLIVKRSKVELND
jgi:hypothetical protein